MDGLWMAATGELSGRMKVYGLSKSQWHSLLESRVFMESTSTTVKYHCELTSALSVHDEVIIALLIRNKISNMIFRIICQLSTDKNVQLSPWDISNKN